MPNVDKLEPGTFSGKMLGMMVTLEDGKHTMIYCGVRSVPSEIAVTVEITERQIKVYLK